MAETQQLKDFLRLSVPSCADGHLFFATSRTEARKMEPRIHKAMRLMTADLRREIQFDELARSVNLSASRLRHLFKSETGISPVQYLKAQRMQKAKTLLETTFLNLKEVMHQAGFTDRSHFVRDFKKAFGLPPLQYRNRHLIAQQKKDSHAIARTATR